MLPRGGRPLSAGLADAPTDPTVPGPVRTAMLGFVEDKLVRTEQAKGETVYLPVDERRVQLAYYKNTILNLVAPRALVACAVLRGGQDASEEAVRTRALFLSRLFKLEFIYRVGAPFEIIFSETVDRLVSAGLLDRRAGALVPRDAQARVELEFLADILRDYLQRYLLAALTLEDLPAGPHGPEGASSGPRWRPGGWSSSRAASTPPRPSAGPRWRTRWPGSSSRRWWPSGTGSSSSARPPSSPRSARRSATELRSYLAPDPVRC